MSTRSTPRIPMPLLSPFSNADLFATQGGGAFVALT